MHVNMLGRNDLITNFAGKEISRWKGYQSLQLVKGSVC